MLIELFGPRVEDQLRAPSLIEDPNDLKKEDPQKSDKLARIRNYKPGDFQRVYPPKPQTNWRGGNRQFESSESSHD